MQVLQEACDLKSSFFVIQKMAFHHIGVEFCQQSIGDIRISQASLYDIARRCTMSLENWLITHTRTKLCMEAAHCLKIHHSQFRACVLASV